MSEDNIRTALTYLFIVGYFGVMLYFISDNNTIKATSKEKNTTDKNIWDKLKILALVIGAIGTLILALAKIIKLMN